MKEEEQKNKRSRENEKKKNVWLYLGKKFITINTYKYVRTHNTVVDYVSLFLIN